jgi:hypothetical protein
VHPSAQVTIPGWGQFVVIEGLPAGRGW